MRAKALSAGFLVDWPHPPSVDVRLEILRSADEAVVCRTADRLVVGFATAVTDHRFAAYIPLAKVLPEHQGQGIGSQMVTALLERLRGWAPTSHSSAESSQPMSARTLRPRSSRRCHRHARRRERA